MTPATDLPLPADEATVISALETVIAETVAPAAEAVDREGTFPAPSLQVLAQAGLGGLLMPATLGGRGTSTATYAEALARVAAACGSTSTVYMTQMHCAHPLHLLGRADQHETWIPALCSGAAVGAIALTEPEAGSDVASMRTTARRDGDSYVINGEKTFISNGDVADIIVLFATVDPGLGKDGITAFLIDTAETDGLEAGKPMKKLGQKGASTVTLSFVDCRVPVGARLGAEGEGYPLLLRSVTKSRISAAAQGVGFAQGAFDAVVGHCAERGLLSSRNRSAQDLQFELARLRAEIAAGRSMLREVCELVDASDEDPTAEVSMVKLHCTALGVRTASACVELLGDDGDRDDIGAERRLRDAKITEIYDGTNQVQSMLVARDIRLSAQA
ncbi:acyl-CoA dehydrogenase family protein [Streptomyces luomodiensis]|uniref:Acyl-CoA dehydrogenase family protein n=1 Tax=Streptomyces luomodiensis TaxID=3026192 RepID=A0ABY9V7W9_9ACTN|nr:acyl-CoA dehydrogenase family protein [Streptomyces sp. SCA4-21]WNF00343.1 acyl-CoA dehydrogenase family protein [Streptomyces sp. SCA4-21]